MAMPHNFYDVLDHMNSGSIELSSISLFFKGIKSAYDSFSVELNKVSDSFRLLKPESSLSKSMHSLKIYFKQIVTNQLAFITSIQSDIIEPLDLFLEHFNTNNYELREQGEGLSRPLKIAKKELAKYKEQYYQSCENQEKVERIIVNENNKIQVTAQKKHYKTLASSNLENYLKSLEETSIFTEIYESEMPTIMESLQQNEESRIHFIKSSAEKYVRFYQKTVEASAENILEFSNSLLFVNSTFDIKNFVGRLEIPVVIKEEFVDYNSWKSQKKIEDLSDVEIVNSIIDFLILKKSGKYADFAKLNGILARREGKDWLVQGLEYRKNFECIDEEAFLKLGEILKGVLSSLEDDEHNQMHFCKIIALSHVFYTENNGQKIYLTDILKSEKIWNDEKRWVNAIELAISAKLLADKEYSQKSLNARKKVGILSTIKDLAQKLPLPAREKPRDRTEKSSAFNILSHFTYQMSNLNVSSQIAHSVIMKISEHYLLEPDRICTLLSQVQLEHAQPQIKKQSKTLSKMCIFKLAIPFLQATDCVTLICLNKHFSEKLAGIITYAWLQITQRNEIPIRQAHWNNQLHRYFPPTDYTALLAKVSRNPDIIGEIGDIIDMDVCRSYQDKLDMHQPLKNILKTYAFYNPDVSYCQGMNFIAGTLLLLFNDENLSFKCLIGLVKKFNMDPMFGEGLPKLRCMIYQLDQLIEIQVPQVQKFFKSEGISAGLFSSSWFLTLFSSNLQNKIPVLLQIWDYFLIKGWKVIFKAAICILKLMETRICSSSFDEVMSLMTGSNLYTEEIINLNFISRIKQVKVSNKLLAQLEIDHYSIVELSSRILAS